MTLHGCLRKTRRLRVSCAWSLGSEFRMPTSKPEIRKEIDKKAETEVGGLRPEHMRTEERSTRN